MTIFLRGANLEKAIFKHLIVVMPYDSNLITRGSSSVFECPSFHWKVRRSIRGYWVNRRSDSWARGLASTAPARSTPKACCQLLSPNYNFEKLITNYGSSVYQHYLFENLPVQKD